MIKITDTHSHYDDEAFDEDRYELLDALLAEKCEKIVTLGCDIVKSRFNLSLAEKYKNVYAAVGVHPENCGDVPDDYMTELRKLAAHPKAVAIGEIGLDYHWDSSGHERQIRFFREHERA